MAKKASKRRPASRSIRRRPPATKKVAPALRATIAQPVTIVGIGASAGGLEALNRLLSSLPRGLNMACVVVQHLSPNHESILAQLLAAATPMHVLQVEDGMKIQTDHVYVIPPGMEMTLTDGHLHLAKRLPGNGAFSPVDAFLTTLADVEGPRAIAVILSGTASDGASGCTAVHAAGGIVLAQDPATAAHAGMPQAAIQTGAVDQILAPEALAEQLARLVRLPPTARRPHGKAEPAFAVTPRQFEKIFAILRRVSGVDFTHYKTPTIKRRLQRRMGMHKIDAVDRYIRLIQESPEEADKLYQDILIHVTSFFREPESFKALHTLVFPKILEAASADVPIRVWIPGCSTGEEAYSVAIELLEFLSERGSSHPIQIFATDVSEAAVAKAREGYFPESIAADVSAERLRRFFSKADGGYRIHKSVRDLCVFARQDLTRDPPFSRLDLIVCRNVLIYLAQPLQRRVMSIFHYALKPTGFLLLGAAETSGPHAELFTLADKRYRVYKKKPTGPRPAIAFTPSALPSARAGRVESQQRSAPSLDSLAGALILDRYAPPSVVVDSHLQIVSSRGHTAPFLQLPSGGATLSVLKMAREGLAYALRSAIAEAQKRSTTVRRSGLQVPADGGVMESSVEVTPMIVGGGDRHYLIVFHADGRGTRPTAEPSAKSRKGSARGKREQSAVARLQRELESSKEYLQAIIQDLEAANEELQSANEEILSSNEELQSTNEELDTAKEELQSTNEEINTVNEELQGRNEELNRLNSDLVNLIGTVNSAIVIVDRGLRVRRFTPMAERLLNLIPTDTGRRIGHIKPELEVPDLEELITRSIDDVAPVEREIRDRYGNWFNLRIRPYNDAENRIDGAVLTLSDITQIRRLEAEVAATEHAMRFAADAAGLPLAIIDGQLRARAVTRPMAQLLRTTASPQPALRFDQHLGLAGDPAKALRAFLESALAGDSPRTFGLDGAGEFAGQRIALEARRIGGPDQPPLLLLTASARNAQHARTAPPDTGDGRQGRVT